MAIITLLTDFGLADTYVGQVKGAILGVAPSTTIVDITHDVAPQDVFAGAFLLWSAVEIFPAGTIHVAVVDPGVGSPRRGLVVRSRRGDLFVGPDNGLLMPAIGRLGGVALAIELTLGNASATFHGRDVFAPVAGHLANAVAVERLGALITDLVGLELPRPRGLEGEVVHVDTFGNLVTNIPADSLPSHFDVLLEGRVVASAAYYAAVAPRELLAIVGSAGLLEISARDASAAKLTGATRGTPVRVVPR